MPVLGEELRGGLAKRVLALLTEQMHPPGLGYAPCEQRLGLGAVSRTRTLAKPFAVDDLVDVPDAAARRSPGILLGAGAIVTISNVDYGNATIACSGRRQNGAFYCEGIEMYRTALGECGDDE